MPFIIELLPDPAARDIRLVQLASQRSSPLDRLNILHGSGLQRWATQRMLAESNGGALAGIYGFTPVDLAQSAARLGNAPERQPWPAGADLMALEQLLNSIPLADWQPDAPGLASAMLRTLTDLREAALTPDDLPNGDLRRVYEAWREAVSHAADRTSFYEDAASSDTPNDAFPEALGGAPLVVSGIYDLTRIQRHLLGRLSDTADVRMLLVDPEGSPDGLPQRTLAALQRDCGARVERPSIPPSPLADERYFSVGDPTSEADVIASHILELGHDGVPFHQIAVLHQQGAAGDDRLCAALERAGVPSWRIGGRRLMRTPQGQVAQYLLHTLLRPETAERTALIDGLSHRSVRIERRPSEWEQAALSAGLDRGLHQMSALLDDSPLADILADLTQRSRALDECSSWTEATVLLRDVVDAYLGAPSEDEPVLEAVRDLIDLLRVHDQLGASWSPCTADSAITRAMNSRVVREAGALEGVHIGAATGPARGIGYEALFVAGAAERIFPAVGRQDPLMPDDARTAINRRVPDALALQRERALSDRHAWMLARCVARRQFTTSFSRRTSSVGGPTRASSFLLDVAADIERISSAVTPFAPTAVEVDADDWSRPLSAPDERAFQLALLSAPGVDTAVLLPDIWPQAEAADVARRQRNAPRFTEFDGQLPGVLEDWRPLERVWNAQQLETFVTCPYRFYLMFVLGIQTPPMLEPQDQQERALGDLTRAVLREWVRGFLRDSVSADEWAAYASDAGLLQELAREHLEHEQQPRPDWSQMRDAVLRNVERLRVRDASDARDGWRPLEVDVAVDDATVRVAGGRELRLSARINRIDAQSDDDRQRAILLFDGPRLPSVRGFADGSSFASVAAVAALTSRSVPVGRAEVEHRSITERGHFQVERLEGRSMLEADGARLRDTLALLADQIEVASFVPNPGQPTRERPNCQRCPVEPACTADLAQRYDHKARKDPDVVRDMEILRRRHA